MATAYGALTMFCVPLLLTLGLLSLATRRDPRASGTRFGLVRYWWVATKLVISLVLTTLVLVALRPTLGDAATEVATVDAAAARPAVGGQHEHDLPADRLDRLLLFAAWLSVYKPWGPTRYGRRFLRVPAARRARVRQSLSMSGVVAPRPRTCPSVCSTTGWSPTGRPSR